MTVLADGGALADAGLVVNICIALGTISAAAVALWLGLQAQRTTRAQFTEARRKQTRQVFATYISPLALTEPAAVEVVNASSEVVTDVVVNVNFGPVPRNDPEWVWVDLTARGVPTLPYLLPGTSAVRKGNFWKWQPDAEPDVERPLILAKSEDVAILLCWQDSYAEVWAKSRHGEAFPSTLAYPGRDIRGMIAPHSRPDHWPEIDPAPGKVSWRGRMKDRKETRRLTKQAKRLSRSENSE